jgi:hypothetical protein
VGVSTGKSTAGGAILRNDWRSIGFAIPHQKWLFTLRIKAAE